MPLGIAGPERQQIQLGDKMTILATILFIVGALSWFVCLECKRLLSLSKERRLRYSRERVRNMQLLLGGAPESRGHEHQG
jgi:hypothetical protein